MKIKNFTCLSLRFVLLLVLLLLIEVPFIAKSQEKIDEIEFVVNSNKITFFQNKTIINVVTSNRNNLPVLTILNNNRTYMPAQLFEYMSILKAVIDYDVSTKKVTATLVSTIDQNKSLILTTGTNQAIVDGEVVILDTSIPETTLTSGIPYFPIRFIFETFDCKVGWDSKRQAVNVNLPE